MSDGKDVTKMPYGPSSGGLVLHRKVGEEVVFWFENTEVVVIVEQASGGRCTLRIVAPDHVQIVRAENIS